MIIDPTTSAFSTAVTHKRQLVAWLEARAVAESTPQISLSCEVFAHDRHNFSPVPYSGENSLTTLLDELQAFKWRPLYEDNRLVGLQRGAAQTVLGPGGQIALQGPACSDMHDAAQDLYHRLDELMSVTRVLDQQITCIGFQPKARREQMPRVPRKGYDILYSHMPETGSLGQDMLLRTASLTSTISYSSESDMVRKMRAALTLQPLVGSLFASSPFRDGWLASDFSFRNRIWLHTDPTRCAYTDFVFKDDFGFENYVNWALLVPMAFVRRDGVYHDLAGYTFYDLMSGKLSESHGLTATLQDWIDHLSMLFPPVRLNNGLELRGADMGHAEMVLGHGALWLGLLQDTQSLDAVEELTQDWSSFDRSQMYVDGPRLVLTSTVAGHSVYDLLVSLCEIARDALKRRAKSGLNEAYTDETNYLTPLEALLSYNVTQAQEMVRYFMDDWNTDVNAIFSVCKLK